MHHILKIIKNLPSEEDIQNHFILERNDKYQPCCVHCEHDKVYDIENGKRWKCAKCKKKYSPRDFAFFAKGSQVSVKKWVIIMWLHSEYGLDDPNVISTLINETPSAVEKIIKSLNIWYSTDYYEIVKPIFKQATHLYDKRENILIPERSYKIVKFIEYFDCLDKDKTTHYYSALDHGQNLANYNDNELNHIETWTNSIINDFLTLEDYIVNERRKLSDSIKDAYNKKLKTEGKETFNFKEADITHTKYFENNFGTQELCEKFLFEKRWGKNPICPHCSHDKTYTFEDGKRFKCASPECSKKFSLISGTLFENSKIPLTKWFKAIYLHFKYHYGISSIQLSEQLKITQKSAWKILQKIKECVPQEFFNIKDNKVQLGEDDFYYGLLEWQNKTHSSKWPENQKKEPVGS